ncbi:MAG: hypothetical protein HZA00_12230 [Nitrospinae bacterium]|nr:hypothetical protein [Nitrospinota bacterium]
MRKKIALVFISCSLIILSSDANGGEEFLSSSEYWERPIPLQIPNSNSELSLSFHPEDCGECHKEQYKGWKGSLHSKAVGPGLLSQIDPHNDSETAVSCYYCHAPMMEQSEVKTEARGQPPQSPFIKGEGQGASNYIKNQFFDNKLKLSGVSCSVCHLREGKVYGPPPRTEDRRQKPALSKAEGTEDRSERQIPHNGFIEEDFFEKAEFCAACHQMDEGYELNGKVLTNTYREWKDSFYGENDITCQSCHMPDRQHLWKGIHDPEMVRGGISIEVIPNTKGAKLVITNSGVGHFFPTYVTPLVIVKGFMMDKKGKTIHSSEKESFIGRKVNLDLDTEIFDTRIAPQKSFEFDYNPNIEIASPSARNDRKSKSVIARSEATKQSKLSGDKLVFEVWVYSDKFYNEFFSNMLKGDNIGIKRKEIEQARKNSSESSYLLWKKEIKLK